MRSIRRAFLSSLIVASLAAPSALPAFAQAVNPVPPATSSSAGIVMPDNTTITVGTGGVISAGGLYAPIMSAIPTATSTGLTTAYNSGATTNGATGLNVTTPNANAVVGVYKTAPVAPYTVKTLVAMNGPLINYVTTGIGWTDGTKVLDIVLGYSNGIRVAVQTWSSPTVFSANLAWALINVNPCWLEEVNNGTTLSFEYSTDGVNYTNLYSVAIASAFVVPTDVLFNVNSDGAVISGTLMSYSD